MKMDTRQVEVIHAASPRVLALFGHSSSSELLPKCQARVGRVEPPRTRIRAIAVPCAPPKFHHWGLAIVVGCGTSESVSVLGSMWRTELSASRPWSG
jgi:hypothetical protein